MASTYDLVIVGGGPAGLSAAIYAARAGLTAKLFEMSTAGGQIASTDSIENYPGFISLPGYDLGDLLKQHAQAAGCDIEPDEVTSIHLLEDGSFDVAVANNKSLNVPVVVYAAGATPRHAGFEGEDVFIGRGVSYCATCDGMFYRDKEVIVVGGGTAACEEALFLSRIARKVTMVVRRNVLRTVPRIQKLLESTVNISVRYNTRISSISGKRFIGSVTLQDTQTGKLDLISVDEGSLGIFVLVGHEPRIELVKDYVRIEHGAVVTDDAMKTKTAGLFAAGDVRTTVLRQVITAASDGAVAAMSAYHYLLDEDLLK